MVCSRSPSDGLGIPLPDFKGVQIRTYDRSGDRIDGWVGPSSTREITASLGRGSRGTVQRSDNDDRVLSLGAGELLRPAWGEEPKTRATKERSSTALRFASFPVPLWGMGICHLFLLDGADALIDGQLCRLLFT